MLLKSKKSNGRPHALSRTVRHFLHGLVLGICCLVPLQSATLERLSLDDMIQKSTAIVRAKVTGSYGGFAGSIIYTHYQLQVSETYKGSAATEVAVPGGVAGNLRQIFAGSPAFSAGDEYVFFLWTGKSGLTQVIGLTQGLFAIAPGAAADPVVTRAASRELMLDPGTARQVQDQTLAMKLSDLKSRISSTLSAAGKGAGK
jgi:hypothetical protein